MTSDSQLITINNWIFKNVIQLNFCTFSIFFICSLELAQQLTIIHPTKPYKSLLKFVIIIQIAQSSKCLYIITQPFLWSFGSIFSKSPTLPELTVTMVCCLASNCGSETDLFNLLKPTALLLSIIVWGSVISVFEIDIFWVWNEKKRNSRINQNWMESNCWRRWFEVLHTFLVTCSILSTIRLLLKTIWFGLMPIGIKFGMASCCITNLSKRQTCGCSSIMNGR